MGKALNIIRIDLRNENGFYIYIRFNRNDREIQR